MVRFFLSVIRYAQSLALLLFSANVLFKWVEMPTLPLAAKERLELLNDAPYFFPLLIAFTWIGSLLLFSGKKVGWALMVLSPIIFYFLLFTFYYHPSHLALPVMLTLHHIILCISNRRAFKSLGSEACV